MVGTTAGSGATGLRTFLAGAGAGKNATQSDLIIIGDSSGGGGLSDAGVRGSVIVGSTSLPVSVDATTDTLGAAGALTIIGWNNFPALIAGARFAATIAIGSNIATLLAADAGSGNFARNLFIGNNIWFNNNAGAGFGSSDNLLIGHQAGSRVGVGSSQWLQNVVIGSQAATGNSVLTISGNVIIGHQACNAMTGSPTNNVVIGFKAGQALAATTLNVLIGAQSNMQSPPNGYNVLIGAQSTLLTGDRNTGVGAVITWMGTGSQNIGIGSRSVTGSTIPANPSNRIVIEVEGNTFVYGNLAGGNFVVGGQPSTAAQRTIPDVPNGATNTFGLVDGTPSGTAPSTGGYFYSVAGVLHWVASSGANSVLSPGAGQLAAATTAYTNNAAAAAGTLTNAPVAGNPTKWIPINDNGTIRNVPAW